METKEPPISNTNLIIKDTNKTIEQFSKENVQEIATSLIKLKNNETDTETLSHKLNIEIDTDSIVIKIKEEIPIIKSSSQESPTNELVQPAHPFFSNFEHGSTVPAKKGIITFEKNEKILLFSPHPDDEILGACALLHKCFTENVKINIVYMTSGKTAGDVITRQNEAKEGIKILNGKTENLNFANMPFYERSNRSIQEDDYIYVKEIINKKQPNIVFVCADVFDPNKTHYKCFEILTKVLFEEEFKHIEVYFYYSVWYTPNDDEYTHILPYSYDTCKLKVIAMLEHKSQMNTKFMGNNSLPFYVRGVMRDEKFGSLNNYEYCEVFYKIPKEFKSSNNLDNLKFLI